MSRNSGIIHSAIQRQILEKKIKRRISASELGDASGQINKLTKKVNAVQSSLSSIYGAIAGLANQIDIFQAVTQSLQNDLLEIQEQVNSLIDSSLQKVSYLLQESGEGIELYELLSSGEDKYEVTNPFNSKDVFVQVVDESTNDEIVGVSVEIEQEKVTLYLAHCEQKGQYRVILMG